MNLFTSAFSGLDTRICSTLLLLLAFSSTALARDYHVEVIIFEQSIDNSEAQEVWNFSPSSLASKFDNLSSLKASSSEMEYQIALEKLSAVESSLRQSGLSILRTANWTKPSEVYHLAPTVSLGTEESILPDAYVKIYKTALIFAELNIQLSPLQLPTEFDANSSEQPESGTATIETTSIESNPAPDSVSFAVQEVYPPHYFLSEKRRLKFGEIHYFDHPKLGVILGVWPVEE